MRTADGPNVLFAEKVVAELIEAAPNFPIQSEARDHIDRATLAIWGLLRSLNDGGGNTNGSQEGVR